MVVDTYLQCCLRLIGGKVAQPDKSSELAKIIATLELLTANLAVALVFLHKYQENAVNLLDTTEGQTMPYYAIVASLVLANKFINDQSYTLKTWHNIMTKFLLFHMPLAVLNQLELNFLAGLNYVLNVKHDASMWRRFDGVNPIGVAQLRQAIDPTSVTPVIAAPVTTLRQVHQNTGVEYGLVTPPTQPSSTFLSPPGGIAYSSYNSTPIVCGPVTPASQQFIAPVLTPGSVVRPLTPQWMAQFQGKLVGAMEMAPCKRRRFCSWGYRHLGFVAN